MSQGALGRTALFDIISTFADDVSNTPYKVGIYTDNITPTVNSLTTDFHEPSGAWAARQDMPAHLIPVWDGASRYRVQWDAVRFTWDGVGTAPTVYGWFIVNATGVFKFGYKQWPAGFTFTLAFPSVTFIAMCGDLNG